jgi:hypothetical protein
MGQTGNFQLRPRNANYHNKKSNHSIQKRQPASGANYFVEKIALIPAGTTVERLDSTAIGSTYAPLKRPKDG